MEYFWVPLQELTPCRKSPTLGASVCNVPNNTFSVVKKNHWHWIPVSLIMWSPNFVFHSHILQVVLVEIRSYKSKEEGKGQDRYKIKYHTWPRTKHYPASKLGYLAPSPTPGQFFMSAKLFIGTPWMRNEVFLKNVLVWAMWKCMVSMATPYIILENRGRPTNSIVSRVLLIIDH